MSTEGLTEGPLTEGPKLTEENLKGREEQTPIDKRKQGPDTASVSSVSSEGSQGSKTSGKSSSIFNIGSLFGSSQKPSPSMMDVKKEIENATSLAQLLNIIVNKNKKEEEQKETVTKDINEAKVNAIKQLQAISELIKKLQKVKNVEPKDINKIAGQDYWYKMRDNIDKDVKFTQGENIDIKDDEIDSLRKNLSRYFALKFNSKEIEESGNEPLTYNKLIHDWKTLIEQAEYEDIKKAYKVLNDEESIKRIIQTDEGIYGMPAIVNALENGIYAGKGYEPTTNNFSDVYLVDGGIFKNTLGTEFIPYIVKDNGKDKLQTDDKGLIVFYDLKSKIDKLYWEGVGKNYDKFMSDRQQQLGMLANEIGAKASDYAGWASHEIGKGAEEFGKGIGEGAEAAREFWFDNKGSKTVKEVKGKFLNELLELAKKDPVYTNTLAKVGNEEEQKKRIKQAILHLMYYRYAPFNNMGSEEDPLIYLEKKIGITNRDEEITGDKMGEVIKTMEEALNEKNESFYKPILEEARKELSFLEKANYGMGVLGGKNKKKTIKKRPKRKGTRRR